MTRPNNPKTRTPRASLTDQWVSRWLVPLVPAALGGVILIAQATNGRILSGLLSFAAFAALSAIAAIAGRHDAARRGQCCVDDERDATTNARAMSIAGTVLIIAITGCTAYTLAREQSTTPYTALLAVGGISYVVALVALRYERS